MSNILNTLTRSHTPSITRSIAISNTDKYIYAAEGCSMVIMDSTVSPTSNPTPTLHATNGLKKFPIGKRGVLPIRMLFDPLGADEPDWKDYIYVAGGRDGLWAISANINVHGGAGIAPDTTTNRGTRLDNRQIYNVDTQDNIRFCNDVKLMEFGGVKYLVVLFSALADTRIRIYDLNTLDAAANAAVDADEEAGHEVQALGEVILGEHPAIGGTVTEPTLHLWGSTGLGMTVSGSDAYVAMGTNGIVKVDFSTPTSPGTPAWGPIFGTGSSPQTDSGSRPLNASAVWYENTEISGFNGDIVRRELPVFLDVAVDTIDGKIYAALDNLGWARFDLASWATTLGPDHHEGKPQDDNERPLKFLLRDFGNQDVPTFVRDLDIKESYNSSHGNILAITGADRSVLQDFFFITLPGITYYPQLYWNGFDNEANYSDGRSQTALYETSALVTTVAGIYNNVSNYWVGSGEVILSNNPTSENWMNVFTYGKRSVPSGGTAVDTKHINSIHFCPMPINWWDSHIQDGSEDSTSTVFDFDLSGERLEDGPQRGTNTFGAEPAHSHPNVLLHGGNDGHMRNTGFLVMGEDDGPVEVGSEPDKIIKAWDWDRLSTDVDTQFNTDEVYFDVGVRTTNFYQFNYGSTTVVGGERQTRKRSVCGQTPDPNWTAAQNQQNCDDYPALSNIWGYWGFKSINIPDRPFGEEPTFQGERALEYPSNSFGIHSERSYYGVVSRNKKYEETFTANGSSKTPYFFLTATNTPEGFILASHTIMKILEFQPITDPARDDAYNFLHYFPDLWAPFETHPEVSGMPRDNIDAQKFWQYNSGKTNRPFYDWQPTVFPIMDSGIEKWIACVPCHSIVNYPKLLELVNHKFSKSGSSTPVDERCDLSAAWAPTDPNLSSNYDHGMALFFDITDAALLAANHGNGGFQNSHGTGDNPVQSSFPKIILPNNPSAVWQTEHIVIDGTTYIFALDMMGGVYVYDAADIFTSVTNLIPITEWDVPASNFDLQINNSFSLAIDQVNPTDTSAYVYVGVKSMGIYVLAFDPSAAVSGDRLTQQEFMSTWDSPYNLHISGKHSSNSRSMILADYNGGIRQYTTSGSS